MTPTEAAHLVDRIAATWRGRLSTAERAVWAETLADLDHETASTAVDRLACTEARRPSIAAIIAAAGGAQPAGPPPPTTTWQVLVHWNDVAKGGAMCDQTWHTSETEARQSFTRLMLNPGATAELLEHHPDKPSRLISQTTAPGAVA